jgi:hypothetical protein
MLRTLLIAGIVACAAPAFAQPQEMPKPGPEQKELARFVGTWKMEGTAQPSPMGPGGKVTGTETCRMFEVWHVVCDATATTPMGPMKNHTILTYDRRAKQYRYFSISNMADAEMATGTRSANAWTFTSTVEMEGMKIHSRFTMTDKSATAYTFTWEVSQDGQKWMSILEGTSTKTGS